ncbi:hypothetical protein DRO38_06630 [Candidatus Bathyarchaeota archaeon]|nr:MAG: hypothetical protein DRO38_06630 [Candidatus Bathyarchaeota archaeon]
MSKLKDCRIVEELFYSPLLFYFVKFKVVSLFHRLKREDVNGVCYTNFVMHLEQYRMECTCMAGYGGGLNLNNSSNLYLAYFLLK